MLVAMQALMACQSERDPGPVRSSRDAIVIAKRYAGSLAFKGSRIRAAREGRSWIVRGENSAKAARVVEVTIDADNGEVTKLDGVTYTVTISKPEAPAGP